MGDCCKTVQLKTVQPKTVQLEARLPEKVVAVQALAHLRGLLPSYRDFCGAAPYYYAAGEVQRLEHQLVEIYSADELAHMSEVIRLQLLGMVHAIREAKGCGIELDG